MVKRGFGPTIMLLLLLSVAAAAVAVLYPYANQGGSNNNNTRIGSSTLITTTSSGFTCTDADYYAFGKGYAAAFKSNPQGVHDTILNLWSTPAGSSESQHFGVNVGGTTATGQPPLFAVLGEATNKLYRFAPCETNPFEKQPGENHNGIDLSVATQMDQPVWAHYDTNKQLLYVAMFGNEKPTGIAVLSIGPTTATNWGIHSLSPCPSCTHVHSVWGFKADEILFADVGAPWANRKGNGVFQLDNDGGQVRQVSEGTMNARVIASDPDGSHLYVVTQEDPSTHTRVYQLQRSSNDNTLKTVAHVEVGHLTNSEGGAIVESLGVSGKVFVTDRSGPSWSGDGGTGYVVDFNNKDNIEVTPLGSHLCAGKPRYSVLKRNKDGTIQNNPYTLLTADDQSSEQPVWKAEFTMTAPGSSKILDAWSWERMECKDCKNKASNIVQV